MEEIENHLNETKERMKKSIQHLHAELAKIRAGKANPTMFDGILVSYYGVNTLLNQVSSVSFPDARTVYIKPWEKNLIPDIERAIVNANIGLTPQNDGQQIIINIPLLSEERRNKLVKQAHQEGEQSKISVRTARKEANEFLKKLQGISEDSIKDAENRIQKITDEFIVQIDDLVKKKEIEVTTI